MTDFTVNISANPSSLESRKRETAPHLSKHLHFDKLWTLHLYKIFHILFNVLIVFSLAIHFWLFNDTFNNSVFIQSGAQATLLEASCIQRNVK